MIRRFIFWALVWMIVCAASCVATFWRTLEEAPDASPWVALVWLVVIGVVAAFVRPRKGGRSNVTQRPCSRAG